MINLLDLKVSVNNMIKKATGYNVKSHSIDDSFNKPALFTELKIIESCAINEYLNKLQLRVRIYCVVENKDEVTMLKISDDLRRAFNSCIVCKDKDANSYRYFDIFDTDVNFNVENNYFMYSFRLSFFERVVEENEDIDIMKHLRINDGKTLL